MTKMLAAHGSKLLELCAHAKKSVFIAAPFIKLSAIKRVIEVIPPDIPLNIVGRFTTEDLVAGVTDLSVVDYVWDRPKSVIFLHPLLHAKLYRIDASSLVGSANLTYRGLGWCPRPNIELLIETPSDEKNVCLLENFLLSTSTKFTKEIRDSLEASCLAEDASFTIEGIKEDSSVWVPTCRRPELLWEIFQGSTLPKCSVAVIENGKQDLNILGIPAWVPENSFKSWIAALLKATPFYQKLMQQYEHNEVLDDHSALEWVEKELLIGRDDITPRDAWDNIKAWIKAFSDDMKVIAQHEAVILKSRQK